MLVYESQHLRHLGVRPPPVELACASRWERTREQRWVAFLHSQSWSRRCLQDRAHWARKRIVLGKNTLNIFGGQIEIGVSQRTLSRFWVFPSIELFLSPLTRCHSEDKYIFEWESTFDSEGVSQLGGSERRHLRHKIWRTSTNSGTTSEIHFRSKVLAFLYSNWT